MGDRQVRVERPRARHVIGDRLQPEPGRAVGLSFDGQAAGSRESAGERPEQIRAVGERLARRITPRALVTLGAAADLQDEPPRERCRADPCRAGDLVETQTLPAPAAEWPAGPAAFEDGRGLAERAPDEGLERRGLDATLGTCLLTHPQSPPACRTAPTIALTGDLVACGAGRAPCRALLGGLLERRPRKPRTPRGTGP